MVAAAAAVGVENTQGTRLPRAAAGPGQTEAGARKKSGAAIQHIRGVGDGFDTLTNFPLVSILICSLSWRGTSCRGVFWGRGPQRCRDTEPERC